MKKRENIQDIDIIFEEYKKKKAEFLDSGMEIPKKIIIAAKIKYPFTRLLLQLITIFSHEKIIALNKKNKKIPKGRNVIYANTHRFKPDFEKISIKTGHASFVVASDFKNAYGKISGWYFNTRPTIFMDPDDSEDKANTFKIIVKLLQSGLRGMIFPESVWNFSENRIVLDTKYGTVKAALLTNSVIVCTGIERYGKKYVINRKDYFDPAIITAKYSDKAFAELDENDPVENNLMQKIVEEANNTMRYLMATSLIEIWEYESLKSGIQIRKEIPEGYWQKYIDSLVGEWPGYKMSDNESQQYQNPEIIKQKEVKSTLTYIKKNPNDGNSFISMSDEEFNHFLRKEKAKKTILELDKLRNELISSTSVYETPISKRLELYKESKKKNKE